MKFLFKSYSSFTSPQLHNLISRVLSDCVSDILGDSVNRVNASIILSRTAPIAHVWRKKILAST